MKHAIDSFQQSEHEKSMKLSTKRSQLLKELENRSGFNIINGQQSTPTLGVDSSMDTTSSTASLLYQYETYAFSLQVTIVVKLVKHHYVVNKYYLNPQFFLPYPSGKQQNYRQELLLKEGVHEERASSVIHSGKKDLPTYGVLDDQFTKNEY